MRMCVIDEHQNQPLAYHLFGPELALTFFPSFAMLFEGKKYRVFTLDHRGEERSRLSKLLIDEGGQGWVSELSTGPPPNK